MSLKADTSPSFQQAEFLVSADKLQQLPPDQGKEIAFIGRSNAGKSSVINAVTGVKGLARTSKTPGRTRLLNYFALNKEIRLVDLPGYGFARVPDNVKKHWSENINRYLQERGSLKGLVLVIDIRRMLRDEDRQLLDWCKAADLPVHILLNKADKLSHGAANQNLQKAQKDIRGMPFTIQVFSALNKTGVDESRRVLTRWLTM